MRGAAELDGERLNLVIGLQFTGDKAGRNNTGGQYTRFDLDGAAGFVGLDSHSADRQGVEARQYLLGPALGESPGQGYYPAWARFQDPTSLQRVEGRLRAR